METTQHTATQSLRNHRILAATALTMVLWLAVITVCRFSGVDRPLGENGVAIALAIGLTIDAVITCRSRRRVRATQQ